MKILLDDRQHRGFDLNANEACIFAAILKCTRAGRGWYGNYRELAAAMPFVISYKTANRAVQKLLTLGLIESRDEKLFSVGQIVPTDGQNVPDDGQNVPENGQSVPPPNNPPINNNKIKEKQADMTFFDVFWDYFNPDPEFNNRKAAAQMLFESRSGTARQAMVNHLETLRYEGKEPSTKNPYFFIQDFPEPQPQWLRGDEGGDIVQVKYNGAFKLCTRATMEQFGLQWIRDW